MVNLHECVIRKPVYRKIQYTYGYYKIALLKLYEDFTFPSIFLLKNVVQLDCSLFNMICTKKNDF